MRNNAFLLVLFGIAAIAVAGVAAWCDAENALDVIAVLIIPLIIVVIGLVALMRRRQRLY